ncbi:uncharacterized protein LODBEIA_P34060 [Lodderomyces beijingensis]|uniref:GH16 domain-containing protein n=1 Tax=Lodderomyces beijingensis TaxID=1775926 RepID=A0ABP0ZSC7_9ASCO
MRTLTPGGAKRGTPRINLINSQGEAFYSQNASPSSAASYSSSSSSSSSPIERAEGGDSSSSNNNNNNNDPFGDNHRQDERDEQHEEDACQFSFQPQTTSNDAGSDSNPRASSQHFTRHSRQPSDSSQYENNQIHTRYPPLYDSQSLISRGGNDATEANYEPVSPTTCTSRDRPPQLSQQQQRISLLMHNSPSFNSLSPPMLQYDRYPKQVIYNFPHSNQESTANLLDETNYSNSNSNSNSSTNSSSFNYSNSSPPTNKDRYSGSYEYEYEFSPFGGYPASQFPLSIDEKEPDDYLHNPDPVLDSLYNEHRFMHDLKNMDRRAFGGLMGLIFMLVAAVLVFVLLPVLTFTTGGGQVVPQVYEVLTNYHYPMLSAIRQTLVDPDTPESALTNVGQDGRVWKLVFSDEFNAEGRTFYDGDDQFFTAPDFHYAATQDLEWYDPDAVTTRNGTLELQLDAFQNHGLFYRSGMVQSWNKMCFTQGKLEFSAKLPGYGHISGLWPGLWSMGNLGRPGYLASTEGIWPYTYDTCDAGITPNQSSPDGISYLPGQRLNSCTCPGESHPNPGVGRGAPEIDALEGEIHGVIGRVSQSLQVAPYDIWYMPDYDFIEIYNKSVTLMNTYTGGPFQQAVSGVTMLNHTWYEMGTGLAHNFQKFGYELINHDENGYITWFVGDEPTFTMRSQALHPNGNIGWRQLPKEPISIIMNLGISNSWAYIDWPSLVFPSKMRVDYVRVYQPEDAINMGCDPPDYPTADYIEQHLNIYHNMNLTNFEMGGYTFPKNRLTGC